MGVESHWQAWHRAYEDPDSSLSRRLAVVTRHLVTAIHEAPEGPVRLISMCAGQGRDVLGALHDHPRRLEVQARLVELDPLLAAHGRAAALAADLRGVDVVTGDASNTSAYADMVPANVIVACGIFGNIAPEAIRDTVLELRRLSARGAVVIWTRHRRPPDLTGSIRMWFADAGFAEVVFEVDRGGGSFGIGVHRLAAAPLPLRPGRVMFAFAPDGADAHLPGSFEA